MLRSLVGSEMCIRDSVGVLELAEKVIGDLIDARFRMLVAETLDAADEALSLIHI